MPSIADFHRRLHVGVERGLDQVAAPGHLILADACARQIVQHVVAEERPIAGRDAAAGQFLRLRQDAQRLRLGGAQRLGLLRQVLDHGVEHDVAAFQRAIGVGVGVQRAGGLHHAGQQRGLLPVQFGGVDAEVGLRGVLDAERVVAERHQVQIAGEDLRLGERLVQRQRHPDLAQLAGRRGLDGGPLLRVGLRDHQQLVVLHILLLDGGAAAGVDVAGHVARQTRQGALPVDAVVLGKPFVLDRDDRQLHRVGDLVAGHLEPALRVEPGDDVALGVDHRRHPRHLALDELGRTVSNHIGGPVRHQSEPADHRKHQCGGHHAGQQAAPRQLDDRDRRRRSIRRALRHALQSNQVAGRSRCRGQIASIKGLTAQFAKLRRAASLDGCAKKGANKLLRKYPVTT